MDIVLDESEDEEAEPSTARRRRLAERAAEREYADDEEVCSSSYYYYLWIFMKPYCLFLVLICLYKYNLIVHIELSVSSQVRNFHIGNIMTIELLQLYVHR